MSTHPALARYYLRSNPHRTNLWATEIRNAGCCTDSCTRERHKAVAFSDPLHELCCLFIHHRWESVTRTHFARHPQTFLANTSGGSKYSRSSSDVLCAVAAIASRSTTDAKKVVLPRIYHGSIRSFIDENRTETTEISRFEFFPSIVYICTLSRESDQVHFFASHFCSHASPSTILFLNNAMDKKEASLRGHRFNDIGTRSFSSVVCHFTTRLHTKHRNAVQRRMRSASDSPHGHPAVSSVGGDHRSSRVLDHSCCVVSCHCAVFVG
jgi:hypothetical protein